MIFVHVMVDSETSLFMETLKLTSFGLDGAEFRGEPRGRMGERDRPSFNRSEGVENSSERVIVVENQFIRGGRVVRVRYRCDGGGEGVKIYGLDITE